MKASLVNLFGRSAALIVCGVAAISILSAPARALTCYTPFSQPGIGTPGPVCADVQVVGWNGAGEVLTPTTTPPVPAWGDHVSVSGGGGGTGITSLVGVSGSVGEGHIKAVSHIDVPTLGSAQVSSRGFLGFVDTITVGPQDVQVNFLSSLSGAFFGAGSGKAVLRVQDINYLQPPVVNDLTTLASEYFPDQTSSALVYLGANQQYALSWGMTAFADANAGGVAYPHPDVMADLSGTGHLYADIVTPGGILTFASGHNYSSTAVTPLPPSSFMMLSALGGLGFLGYRRRMTFGPR
jgi:hypothetical protein